jgi:sulfotransferase
MENRFFFLGGLPRTGSTLLCSLLAQNPNIHAEGDSILSELLWRNYLTCLNEEKNDWNHHILASKNHLRVASFLNSIANVYYSDISKKYIFDKCKGWANKINVDLIKSFITPNPKIVLLIRPVEEVVSSLVKIKMENNIPEEEWFDEMFDEGKNPIMFPIQGIKEAIENDNGEYLFIKYDEIVFDTEKTLEKIYAFCEIESFEHNLKNIQKSFEQDDTHYKLLGLHDIRSTISKRKYDMNLPDDILEKCYHLNKMIGL